MPDFTRRVPRTCVSGNDERDKIIESIPGFTESLKDPNGAAHCGLKLLRKKSVLQETLADRKEQANWPAPGGTMRTLQSSLAFLCPGASRRDSPSTAFSLCAAPCPSHWKRAGPCSAGSHTGTGLVGKAEDPASGLKDL